MLPVVKGGGGELNMNATIPVGIAVARQRLPHELAPKDAMPLEERSAQLAAWPQPPPLWQCPPQVSVESMVGLGGALGPLGGLGALPPVAGQAGAQLVRDPSTGALILVPAADHFQQVVWGGYVGAGVFLPPVQLVGAELLSSTTLHHHTQTHSTRLVALAASDPKRTPAVRPLARPFDECQQRALFCHPPPQPPPPPLPPPPPREPTVPRVPPVPPPAVQDASNQTDTPVQSEEEEPPRPSDDEDATAKRTAPDLSGLELLSNSIEQFEKKSEPSTRRPPPPPPPPTVEGAADRLGGLGLLCALAEQKRMELMREAEERRLSRPPPLSTPPSQDPPPRRAPRANAHELTMIRKLADLQRQYRETRRELIKLTPKRGPEGPARRGPGRPRKKSSASETAGSSPSAEIGDVGQRRESPEARRDSVGLRPSASLSPVRDTEDERPPSEAPGSSKKRKVGRPKKLPTAPGSRIATETIVAKKPKSKSGLVGYLLAKGGLGAPPGSEGPSRRRPEPGADRARPRSPPCVGEAHAVSRIRPTLKAEPKVKDYSEEDDVNEWCGGGSRSDLTEAKSRSPSLESLQEVHLKNRLKTDLLALKHKKSVASDFRGFYPSSDSEPEERSERRKVVRSSPSDSRTEDVPRPGGRCAVPLDDLGDGEIRVLAAMGGLFYAGALKAVRAPDLYSVTLDGERGNRPHILSREEALRDVILEVCPPSTAELAPGTRLCAYWSQQYRCLYPGTVAEPSSPDPLDDGRFVAVEFDDGDSGRIALEDIRYLQSDYPVVEYDPNPLLTLGKRRRRASVDCSEDRKRGVFPRVDGPTRAPVVELPADPPASSSDLARHGSRLGHRERKRLKKHKRDRLKKLLCVNGETEKSLDELVRERKKRKKHKGCDEHCKHRKHRKHHRKHKRHHRSNPIERSGSSSEDLSRASLLKPTISQPKFYCVREQSSGMDKTSSPTEVAENDAKGATLLTEDVDDRSPENVEVKNINGATEKESPSHRDTASPETDSKILDKAPALQVKTDSRSKRSKKATAPKDNTDDPVDASESEIPAADPPVPKKKSKRRTGSSTSDGATNNGASKMAAFLPAGAQLWDWKGSGHRRPQARGKAKKCFYKAIQRGNEVINVGDSAVFLSTGRPDRPYIGQVESLWEGWQGNMAVRVRWYYHPEETTGCPGKLTYPGGLFESPHTDENDVQTISHKCEVIALSSYRRRLTASSDTSDVYYRAGHYNPSLQTLQMEPDIPYTPA